jgi:hypothetical protein
MARLALLAALLGAAASIAAVDARAWNERKRVLMVLPKPEDRGLYMNFIDSISQYGYSVDVKGYKDASIKLKDYDRWNYDQLVIFAPKADSEGRWGPLGT